jgi:hypothetical protein
MSEPIRTNAELRAALDTAELTKLFMFCEEGMYLFPPNGLEGIRLIDEEAAAHS